MEKKRLFIGLEAQAPWPEQLPEGRLVASGCRHMTLAFLGATHTEGLFEHVEALGPPTNYACVGYFDRCVFLPSRHARVAAWRVALLTQQEQLETYHEKLLNTLIAGAWLKEPPGYAFLPHVTLARRPFQVSAWREAFKPLPVLFTKLHVYESHGNLNYSPLYTQQLTVPFEKFERQGTPALLVRGRSLHELLRHAQIALAFEHPSNLKYLEPDQTFTSLEEVVLSLNSMVAVTLVEGHCKEDAWEMILERPGPASS